MMSGLTHEQKRRIEENRRKALERRAARQNQPAHQQQSLSNTFSSRNIPPNQSYGQFNQQIDLSSCVRHAISGANVAATPMTRMPNQQADIRMLKPLVQTNKTNTVPYSALGPNIAPRPANPPITIFNMHNKASKGASFYGNNEEKKRPISQSNNNNGFGGRSKNQSPSVDKLFDVPPSRQVLGGAKAKCILISRTRFEVEAGFNKQLIDLFKTMKTKSYGEF